MKKITLKSADQKIWFVSDLHLGHDKPFILGPRKYQNVSEAYNHTHEMLKMIGPDDILFNLGDMVIGAGANSMEYAKRIVYLPCKHQYFIEIPNISQLFYHLQDVQYHFVSNNNL
jgi:calcineurin-like phosphoesterase family protein